MPIFSSTITKLASSKMEQPFYRFDGENDYIDISSVFGGNGDLDTQGTIGYVECLFRVNEESTGEIVSFGQTTNNSRNRCIYFKNNSAGNNKMYIDLEQGNANKYRGEGAINIPLGEPVHVVFVQDGTEPKIYVNGVQDTITFSVTTDKTKWFAGTNNGWNTAHIGSHQSGGDPQGGWFRGDVFRVRIGNHPLSATEVQELYTGNDVDWAFRTGTNKYLGFCANAGHNLTTDWTNASSGVASGMAVNGTASIVTGNGFSGNAQKSQGSSGYGAISVPLSTSFGSNEYLYIRMKYRSGNEGWRFGKEYGGGGISQYNFGDGTYNATGRTWYRIDGGGWKGGGTGTITIPNNTGNAKLLEAIVFTGSHTDDKLGMMTVPWNDWLEVDEVQVYQAGTIAHWDGSGISSDKWFDKSGNDLHGTVNGASVENAPSGDDGLVYEEGTWTPGPNSFGGTYDKHGSYVRVGKLVTARGYIQATNNHADSSHFIITGLPFVGVSSVTGTWGAFLTRGRYNSADIEKITDMFLHKQEGNDRIAGYDAGGDLTYTDVGFDSNQMIGFVVIYQCV